MSNSKRVRYFLVLICIASAVGCSPSQEQAQNEPSSGEKIDTSSASDLAGVHYPKAVIRFRVGAGSWQEVTEGLHYETSKREKGNLTGGDVNGDEFVLSWEYLGSDDKSDNYQMSLKLPGDQEPSQNRKLQYSGENSVSFYESEKVRVTVEKSLDNVSEDQP